MTDSILSVGIDVGTTTFHFVTTRLSLESNSFQAGPRITGYETLYQSDIHLTPYLERERIDEERILALYRDELAAQGIDPEGIQSGAVIATGVAAASANAGRIINTLSSLHPCLVSTIAGPRMESLLAARGAGIDLRSRDRFQTVLNVDIGGGTSNIAVFSHGRAIDTASLWIGGRLAERSHSESEWRLSPVASRLCGTECVNEDQLKSLIDRAARDLIDAIATLRIDKHWLDQPFLQEKHCGSIDAVSFSGGVGEWIATLRRGKAIDDSFDDCGLMLARAILEQWPDSLPLIESSNGIRATAIGAGAHSVALSGDTIYIENPDCLPLANLPVVAMNWPCDEHFVEMIERARRLHECNAIAVSLNAQDEWSFDGLECLAQQLAVAARQAPDRPIVLAVHQNAAKIIGYRFELEVRGVRHAPLIAIDGVAPDDGEFIDIGVPLKGGAVPVTAKTLFFSCP